LGFLTCREPYRITDRATITNLAQKPLLRQPTTHDADAAVNLCTAGEEDFFSALFDGGFNQLADDGGLFFLFAHGDSFTS
jgi:hypothetical protein